MTIVASKTFTTHLVRECSMRARPDDLGKHESTMDLHDTPQRDYYFIEWDIPSIEECEHIGIWIDTDTRELTDYDGVFSLPKEAIQLLEAYGFGVGEDFR